MTVSFCRKQTAGDVHPPSLFPPRSIRRGRWIALLAAVLLVVTHSRGQAPADSTEASSVANRGILPLPVVFYTPETGWAGGASVLVFFHPEEAGMRRRPSTEVLAAIYSERRQFLLELAGELYLANDQYKVIHDLQWQRFPSYFYGIGSRALEEMKEPYTVQSASADVSVDRRVSDALSVGGVLRYNNERFVQRDPNGILIHGTVPGSQGSTVFGLGAEIVWDTRDRLYSSHAGNFSTLSSVWCGLPGSTYRFLKSRLDLRQYVPIDDDRSLALQTLGVLIGGTAPFRELGRIGGAYTLRGYYDGRYRDNAMLMLQGEFRTMLAGRFGAVVFAGAGTVAHVLSGLEWRTIRPSAGAGLRYIFDLAEHLTLRLDFGWGQNSSGVYIMANEAI